MTANEYMKKIKDNLDSVEQNLEQIQCDDCISRQAVLDEMMLIPIAPLMVGDGVVYKKGVLEGTIKALPSVTPQPIITNKSAVFWLENITEKYLKGDTFEDRQMKKSINKAIKALSKEPKTGYWIEHEIENTLRWLECSNCHCETSYNVMHNYCPYCGAKMVEPQESEE